MHPSSNVLDWATFHQDRDVQRLMDELDLPPDRANLFEVENIRVGKHWCFWGEPEIGVSEFKKGSLNK